MNLFSTSSRFDPKGKNKVQFFINKINKNSFNLIVDQSLKAEIMTDFDKFIIMEDVDLKIAPGLEN